MKAKTRKPIKQASEHDKNIDFAFHEFGFFGITQYRIMVFFWMLQVAGIPKILADAYYGQNASWMSSAYSHFGNFWTVADRTPTLTYAGAYTIVVALTHPWFVMEFLKKIPFLRYEIQRSLMDYRTIVYSLFIALLSSRLVDVCVILVEIITMGSPVEFLIIR